MIGWTEAMVIFHPNETVAAPDQYLPANSTWFSGFEISSNQIQINSILSNSKCQIKHTHGYSQHQQSLGAALPQLYCHLYDDHCCFHCCPHACSALEKELHADNAMATQHYDHQHHLQMQLSQNYNKCLSVMNVMPDKQRQTQEVLLGYFKEHHVMDDDAKGMSACSETRKSCHWKGMALRKIWKHPCFYPSCPWHIWQTQFQWVYVLDTDCPTEYKHIHSCTQHSQVSSSLHDTVRPMTACHTSTTAQNLNCS